MNCQYFCAYWQNVTSKDNAALIYRRVDVRVMYDDFGSISTFNFKNAKELRELGIPCVTFNLLLAIKGTANYRDHRKMLIVDENIAYSGGINLADCYINLERQRRVLCYSFLGRNSL